MEELAHCLVDVAAPHLREGLRVLARGVDMLRPYTDPYVRWCGRGGAERLPPIPIFGTNLPIRDVRSPVDIGSSAVAQQL
jgi:hypothetical protein